MEGGRWKREEEEGRCERYRTPNLVWVAGPQHDSHVSLTRNSGFFTSSFCGVAASLPKHKQEYRTPLIYAATCGHADVVEALLLAGADPETTCRVCIVCDWHYPKISHDGPYMAVARCSVTGVLFAAVR